MMNIPCSSLSNMVVQPGFQQNWPYARSPTMRLRSSTAIFGTKHTPFLPAPTSAKNGGATSRCSAFVPLATATSLLLSLENASTPTSTDHLADYRRCGYNESVQ